MLRAHGVALEICFKTRHDRNAASMGHSARTPLAGATVRKRNSAALPVLLSMGLDVRGSAYSAQVLELCAGQALCGHQFCFRRKQAEQPLADPADSSADRTMCVIVFPDL